MKNHRTFRTFHVDTFHTFQNGGFRTFRTSLKSTFRTFQKWGVRTFRTFLKSTFRTLLRVIRTYNKPREAIRCLGNWCRLYVRITDRLGANMPQDHPLQGKLVSRLNVSDGSAHVTEIARCQHHPLQWKLASMDPAGSRHKKARDTKRRAGRRAGTKKPPAQCAGGDGIRTGGN